MRIAVCCKFTPDTEDVFPEPDGSVSLASTKWGVSEYDLQAVQAAAEICSADDETVAVTAGASNINQPKLAKELLSRGNLARLFRVADDALEGADSAVVAKVLAAAVSRVGADVVLFGEGSSDRYARTMGAQVAAELGWPSVNVADRIEVRGDSIVVERDVEDGIEVVELSVPCAISTTSTINIPPLPTMKAVLGAGKKPIEDASVGDLGVDACALVEQVSVEVPAKPGRQQVLIEGTPDEMAAQLIAKLQADQVL